jgi:Holliday junction resolvase
MKRKGSRTERELLHMFFREKWGCIRTAGSGNTSELATDLIAGKNGRVLAIECKSGKRDIKRYLKTEQVEGLKEFSKMFGAEAWIGMRYDNEDWWFLEPKQLDKSKKGTYCVNLKLAQKKGILFEELIKKFKQRKL